MSTSVFTSVCTSNLLQTKNVQAYRGGLSTIPKTDKSGDMESVCHAIVNTVANLYNVQTREDYAHYVKNIAPVLLSKVHGHVAKQEPILMVVLASQLSQHEGVRKFKPEDSLIRLDQLCKQISTIYRPGAKVDVVMDGLIHNGLFGIGDVEEWDSINAVQEVAIKKYSNTLKILPIWNLLQDEQDDIPLPLEEARSYFLHHAQLMKEHLIAKFGNLNNNSVMVPPTFKAKYINEYDTVLRGGEKKRVEAKVALQVLANMLDSAFNHRVHISL